MVVRMAGVVLREYRNEERLVHFGSGQRFMMVYV